MIEGTSEEENQVAAEKAQSSPVVLGNRAELRRRRVALLGCCHKFYICQHTILAFVGPRIHMVHAEVLPEWPQVTDIRYMPDVHLHTRVLLD